MGAHWGLATVDSSHRGITALTSVQRLPLPVQGVYDIGRPFHIRAGVHDHDSRTIGPLLNPGQPRFPSQLGFSHWSLQVGHMVDVSLLSVHLVQPSWFHTNSQTLWRVLVKCLIQYFCWCFRSLRHGLCSSTGNVSKMAVTTAYQHAHSSTDSTRL